MPSNKFKLLPVLFLLLSLTMPAMSISVGPRELQIQPHDLFNVRISGTAEFLPNRYDKRNSLQLQQNAAIEVTGQSALLAGDSGTVELRFSPRNFRLRTPHPLQLELRLTSDCTINGEIIEDTLFFNVQNGRLPLQRHFLPVYLWHSDGSDYYKFQQLLTFVKSKQGILIFLNGNPSNVLEDNTGKMPDIRAPFFMQTGSTFEFIGLRATPSVTTASQAIDHYVSLVGKMKLRDRSLIRVPHSSLPMLKSDPAKLENYKDAAAIRGMNDILNGTLIQTDLEYFLKYDEQHFYLLSAAPVNKKRSLNFFAMLKYTETFDQEKFTMNPWNPLFSAGTTDNKWFVRNSSKAEMQLSEAWIESFTSFGVDSPGPGTRWEANFSCRNSETDYGAWFQAEDYNSKSYGMLIFAAEGELFARVNNVPVIQNGKLIQNVVAVNPGKTSQRFSCLAELFQQDGECFAQDVQNELVAAGEQRKVSLSISLPDQGCFICTVSMLDENNQLFYRRSININRSEP